MEERRKEIKMPKIDKTQSFWVDENGDIWAGYFESGEGNNFHYYRPGLSGVCWGRSGNENLTPINFKEGLELWNEKIREDWKKLLKQLKERG